MKSNNVNEPMKTSWVLSIVITVVLFVAAIGFVNLYPRFNEYAHKNRIEVDTYNNRERIANANFSLYYKLKGVGSTSDEALLTMLDLSKVSEDYRNDVKQTFMEDLSNFNERLDSVYRNLEYYVSDGTQVVTNNEGLKGYYDHDNADLEPFMLYVEINYNSNGIPVVINAKGIAKDSMQHALNNFIERGYGYIDDTFGVMSENEYYNDNTSSNTEYDESVTSNITKCINNPKDVTYVYAIRNSMQYYDNYYWEFQHNYSDRITSCATMFFLVFCGAMAFLALVIPYRREKQMYVMQRMLKVPLELVIGIGIMVVVAMVFVMIEVIPDTINQAILSDVVKSELLDIKTADMISYWGNVITVMVLLYCVIWAVVYLKNMIHNGIFRTIRERSLFIMIFRRVFNGIGQVFDTCTSIDLSIRSNSKLFFLILFNTAVSVILCCLFVFGIPLAIIYNMIIFMFIRKKVNDTKDCYQMMLRVTEKIAEGRLDETIDVHLGMFEPFKQEISKIQSGLKKAVEEEVKSQNMKTELISNVSHDLKTPLTAIITYVDLLKNENLTKEQQKEFIDVLDRKSQRLKVLIEDLFEMSKATSRNINLNYMQLDFALLVKEVLLELDEKMEDANLSLKKDIPEEKIIVTLDSQRTYRILENLLVNITKYAMPYSRVYVSIHTSEQEVFLTLKNISANEINYEGNDLMERFVRGDQSRNTEGSGLGLAIAKSLTEAQGGRMSIEVDGDLFKVVIAFPRGVRGELIKEVAIPIETEHLEKPIEDDASLYESVTVDYEDIE